MLKDDCDKGMDKLSLALWGKDGRGGMVRDIQEMKTKLNVATGIIRTVIIPIVVPLTLGGIGYLIGKFAGL